MVPDVKQGKQLPEGWEFKELSSLFQERRETSSDLEKYPLYSLTIEEGLIEKPERYNREFLLKNRQDNQYRLVYPGDFVFNPMNLRWGAIAMSRLSKAVTVSAYYNVLSLDSSIIPSNLLLTILRSPQMLNVYDNVGKGTLVEKKRVHLNVFLKLKIPIPPITQSKEINAILSSVDEAIASTQAVIDQTRKVKQGLLQQLLTRGIGHTKFKESAIGKIPECWDVVNFGEILIEIVAGKSPNCPRKPAMLDKWGVLKVSAVGFGEFFPEENKVLSDSYEIDAKYIVNPGDLLISRANTKELVGAVCVVPNGSYNLMLCDKTLRLQLNDNKADARFICKVLLGESSRKYFEENATGTSSSMKNISQELIRNLILPLPPLSEQKAIVEFLVSLDSEHKLHTQQLQQLQTIKRGLMQDLLTGKVRVYSKE